MEFNNKLAVIIGGNSGIGKATALLLASKKANIAIIATDSVTLETTKEELSHYSVKVKTYSCDITKNNDVHTTFEKINNELGKIDFLVNSAGCHCGAPIEKVTIEQFDKEIAINLNGVFYCLQSAFPFMKKGGAIVNIGSIRGRKGTKTTSPGYSAAKAGIINLTKSYARQLAKYEIRVNAVAPGAIFPTGMTKNWTQEKRECINQKNLMGRIGRPEEVASAIYFLLSDLSSYVNGQTIDINGGDWMN